MVQPCAYVCHTVCMNKLPCHGNSNTAYKSIPCSDSRNIKCTMNAPCIHIAVSHQNNTCLYARYIFASKANQKCVYWQASLAVCKFAFQHPVRMGLEMNLFLCCMKRVSNDQEVKQIESYKFSVKIIMNVCGCEIKCLFT